MPHGLAANLVVYMYLCLSSDLDNNYAHPNPRCKGCGVVSVSCLHAVRFRIITWYHRTNVLGTANSSMQLPHTVEELFLCIQAR